MPIMKPNKDRDIPGVLGFWVLLGGPEERMAHRLQRRQDVREAGNLGARGRLG